MSPNKPVHTCRCPQCLAGEDHPDRRHHEHMNTFMVMLNRQQRRVYAAIEATRIGPKGNHLVSLITGLSMATIGLGRRQLTAQPSHTPLKLDKWAAGRTLTETKYSRIGTVLEQILSGEVAGDPMNEQAWIRNSVEHIRLRLQENGIDLCWKTVGRVLRCMGFSMKYSKKRRAGSGQNCPEREAQFGYIAATRTEFLAAGLPVICIDTKKKELVGNFKKPGRVWCRRAPEVEEHDFPSLATCRAVPFGIYDMGRNVG